jgi:type IX secretion system substrate protein
MKKHLLLTLLAYSLVYFSYGSSYGSDATIVHVNANGTTDNGSTPVSPCNSQTYEVSSYDEQDGDQLVSVTWQWSLPGSSTFTQVTTPGTVISIPVVNDMSLSAIINLKTALGVNYTVSSNSIGITVVPVVITFSASNPGASCAASQDYSIDPICATSYTYTIAGNSGVYFTGTANSQTLTTSATTVNISFPSTGGGFSLYVSSTYSNGAAGPSSVAAYSFGVPPLSITINKIVGITAVISTQNYAGYTYTWTVNGAAPNNGSTGSGCQDELICGKANPVKVTATNACGTTTATNTAYVKCGGGGPQVIKASIVPNPTPGAMKVTLQTDMVVSGQSQEMIKAIRIVDMSGKLVRKFEFGAGVTEANITTGGLGSGIYILHVFDGTQWTNEKIIVK